MPKVKHFILTNDGPVLARTDPLEGTPDHVRDGGYRRVHFYSFQDVLKPRGEELGKESLSAVILEHLRGAFNSWTDPRYSDSVSTLEAVPAIRQAAEAALKAAVDEFVHDAFVKTEKVWEDD